MSAVIWRCTCLVIMYIVPFHNHNYYMRTFIFNLAILIDLNIRATFIQSNIQGHTAFRGIMEDDIHLWSIHKPFVVRQYC